MTNTPDAPFDEAARITWDAIVIGAGPAGTLAARQTARAGLRTLLIDAKVFPRDKVCGGYLNRRALEVLNHVGLAHLTSDRTEDQVNQLEIIYGARRTRFPLPPGRIICRSTFDAALLESARLAGAEILLGAQAAVDPVHHDDFRRVTAVRAGLRHDLNSRFVICADGLARTSVRQLPGFASSTAANSRIGLGAVVTGDIDACPIGQITMVLSRRGYVGISRIQNQQFNIAAAVDRTHLLHSTPAEVISRMLGESGIHFPAALMSANWRGTPPLTTRPLAVASERVVLIGDVSGYVEPFTGEGMATALEAAVAVTPLAVQAVKSWSPAIAANWKTLHWQMVRDRQRTCRQLAWILRRPWASFAALSVCRLAPGIAGRVIARTSAPMTYHAAAEMSTT